MIIYKPISLSKLAVLFALFTRYLAFVETSNPMYKWEPCIPKITFLSCIDTSAEEPKILYNSLTYVLEIAVKRGCDSSDLSNYWQLVDRNTQTLIDDYNGRKNKNTLTINKFQFDVGDYILIANVRETAVFTGDVWVESRCFIKIVTACPVMTIAGGYYKTVPKGYEITISSARSFTCMLDVRFTWSCTSSEPSENCRKINGKRDKEVNLIVDSNVGSTYTITVSGSFPGVPTKTFTQIINVTNPTNPVLFISCLKNCLRTGSVYSDPSISVFIKALCHQNCDPVKSYKWTLKALTESKPSAEEIMQDGTYTGTDKEKIIFKPNWLNYGAVYDLKLTALGSDGTTLAEAMLYINMTTNIGGQANCTTSNNGKTGLLRKYIINCVVPTGTRPAIYKLQQMIHEPFTGELIARTLMYSSDAHFELRLGHSGNSSLQKLVLVAVDDTKIMTNTTFDIEVQRPFGNLSSDDLIIAVLHAYHGLQRTDSVKFLFQIGKISKASRLLNLIFCESHKLDITEPGIKRLRIKLQITMLMGIASTTKIMSTDIEYLLALLPHFVVDKTKDLRHAKFKSRFCRYIAKGFHDAALKSAFPLTYQSYLELMTIPLYKCANDYFNDDYDKPRKFNVPLPPPIPQHIPPFEDYPNYGDEIDDLSDEDLKETVANSLQVINDIGQVYGHTFIFGEPRVYINYSANTSVDIVHGLEKNRPPYESTDLKIVLPDYIAGLPNETVHVVISTLPVSTFFWDYDSVNMSDFVVNVNIYNSVAKRVTMLENDAHVYFKTTPKQDVSLRNASMNIPVDNVEWTEEFVEKYMKVFRIGIKARHSFMAVFDDISPVNSLRVAITEFRKPIKEDFQLSAQSGKKTYLFNYTDEDTWYYCGLLPDENEIKKLVARNDDRLRRSDYSLKLNDDYTISLNRHEPELMKINFRYGFISITCKEWVQRTWDRHHCMASCLLFDTLFHPCYVKPVKRQNRSFSVEPVKLSP